MLTICRFIDKDDTRHSEELHTWNDADRMRKDYSYVLYDGKYYEMVMFNAGYGVYDQECLFLEIDSVPKHVIPTVIKKSSANAFKYNKCECGSHRVNSNRHSYYCPLFKEQS